MSPKSAARRFRFDLSFLLFWVTPYIAAVAALTTWQGPYASSFLNRMARISVLIGLTIGWVIVYASRRAARRDDESSDPPPERSGAASNPQKPAAAGRLAVSPSESPDRSPR